jgi:hypothetical protein
MTFITTTNTSRARLWTRIFETDQLPVLCATPRLACFLEGERLVFDLDTGALHEMYLARLAAHVANHGMRYEDALASVRSGFPILAMDCQVIEAVDSALDQPSFAARLLSRLREVFARKQWPVEGSKKPPTQAAF